MSKFTINNPAFLSMAGNTGISKGSDTFYITALEDNTTLTFIYPAFTEISTNNVDFFQAEETMTLNAGNKIYIRVSSGITEVLGLSLFNIDKKYNAGGICPSLAFYINKNDTVMEATFLPKFEKTDIVDASELIVDISSVSQFENSTAGMFLDCTNLTTPPQLPVTTLQESCYTSMFRGCTSLRTAPVLPATTLQAWCYTAMFMGCTSLRTAPVLPATTLQDSCYLNMFADCTSLEEITCLAVNAGAIDSSTQTWLRGCSETGTFIKAAGVEWPSGESGIPSGWTIQDYAG